MTRFFLKISDVRSSSTADRVISEIENNHVLDTTRNREILVRIFSEEIESEFASDLINGRVVLRLLMSPSSAKRLFKKCQKSKYRVGDKVRVRANLSICDGSLHGITYDMVKLAGKLVKITRFVELKTYEIDLDDGGYWWDDTMFEDGGESQSDN